MPALISHGTPYVFFYGPLLTGSGERRLDVRLRRILRPYSAAYTQARLYDLGGHPAAVASQQANERVYGTVFSLRRPDLLQQLDRQTLSRAALPRSCCCRATARSPAGSISTTVRWRAGPISVMAITRRIGQRGEATIEHEPSASRRDRSAPRISQVFSNRAMHSTWVVCGNMSITPALHRR